MALNNIDVQCLKKPGQVDDKQLTVNTFAGRITLLVKDKNMNKSIFVECYFEDLKRAWKALKPNKTNTITYTNKEYPGAHIRLPTSLSDKIHISTATQVAPFSMTPTITTVVTEENTEENKEELKATSNIEKSNKEKAIQK